MKRLGLTLVVACGVSGCASNVEVRYPAPSGSPRTGAVLIRFTEAMRSVSVSVDGLVVAEDEHTGRVRIADVPLGRREITVVASGRGRATPVERRDTLVVSGGEEASILVAVPPQSLGYWIWSAALLLGYTAVLLSSDHWRR